MHWIALSSSVSADASADQPADPRLALAWWALTYTSRVALLDEAVLMEVSTSERLWGGRAQLLERIFKQNRPQTLGSAAFAATSLEALGLLRLVLEGTARPTSRPAGLPLWVLSAAQPHLPTLSRIGCRTWGDVRALPRAGVARRFGAGLLDALDTAWGQRPETHAWLRLPEQFDATFELPALTQAAPALLFGAQRLLHQLRVWLAGRQLGVLAFELRWLLEARRFARNENLEADAREQHLIVRTALATQDVAHLLRLLSEQFARIRLPAPVHALRLRSLETAPLASPSRNLLPEDRSAPADAGTLQQLAERLTVRLGAGCVLHAMPQADHRPERMQRWQPMPHALVLLAKARQQQPHRAGAVEARPDRNGHWLPTWLLREPLPLAVQGGCPQFYGPLELLAGPDRLEAGWWVMEHGESVRSASATNQPVAAPQPALRDYFIAHGTQAGLLWIYRERLGHVGAAAGAGASGGAGGGPDGAAGSWFLQGLYA